jgi:hypothetical protein
MIFLAGPLVGGSAEAPRAPRSPSTGSPQPPPPAPPPAWVPGRFWWINGIGVRCSGNSVDAVQAGSPAHRVGVRKGDELYVLDENSILPAHYLEGTARKKRPGEMLRIMVVRDGFSYQYALQME